MIVATDWVKHKKLLLQRLVLTIVLNLNWCSLRSVVDCELIFQYIVMNSVEERMLTLQEGKRTLMGQAFGVQRQSQEERRRARVRDIKHLIGL